MEVVETYLNELAESVIRGTAVVASERWLTLATDGLYTEATTITRINLDTVMAAAAAGASLNDIIVEFNGLDPGDYSHWIICNHVTDASDTSWVLRGVLPVAGAAPTVTFSLGAIDMFVRAVA